MYQRYHDLPVERLFFYSLFDSRETQAANAHVDKRARAQQRQESEMVRRDGCMDGWMGEQME